MSQEPREVRASNADRERTVEILRLALAEGMLSLEEVDERQAVVYGAKFQHELDELLRDLPQSLRWRTPAAQASWRRGSRRHLVAFWIILAVAVTMTVVSGGQFFWAFVPFLVFTLLLAGIGRMFHRGMGHCPPGRFHGRVGERRFPGAASA